MIVEVYDLWRRYGRFDALEGLSFGITDGSAFALVGPNGAGKTTTIKILMNLLEPSRGNATILGVDSRSISPRELADIGYVSENQDMPGRMTVMAYINYLRPFYPNWDRALESKILGSLRLPSERKIKDLSHGMRLKMALACALPFRPRLECRSSSPCPSFVILAKPPAIVMRGTGCRFAYFSMPPTKSPMSMSAVSERPCSF